MTSNTDSIPCIYSIEHMRVKVCLGTEALTGFNAFRFGWTSTTTYNDVLRAFYDALYRMNAEVDFVDPSTTDLPAYKLIVVPGLYAAADAEIERLNALPRREVTCSTRLRAACPTRM